MSFVPHQTMVGRMLSRLILMGAAHISLAGQPREWSVTCQTQAYPRRKGGRRAKGVCAPLRDAQRAQRAGFRPQEPVQPPFPSPAPPGGKGASKRADSAGHRL